MLRSRRGILEVAPFTFDIYAPALRDFTDASRIHWPFSSKGPSLPRAGHREAVIELRFVPQDCDAVDGALPTAPQTRRMCRWGRASGARPRYQRGGRQS